MQTTDLLTGAPRQKRWRTVTAIVAGAMVALLINEYAAGLAVPAFDPRQHVRFVDPDGPGPAPSLAVAGSEFRQIKNTGDYDVTVRINRHGLRDAKDISQATPGDYVLVGDSFTFGWGVEEDKRVSEQLEQRLGKKVYNVAITGNFNTYQALLDYGEQQGAKIRKVLIGVTMESDILRYKPGPTAATGEPSVSQPPSSRRHSRPLLQIKEWLTRHSTLYFMMTTAVHQNPTLKMLAVKAGLIVPNLEGIHQRQFDTESVETSAARLARIARRYEVTAFLIPSRGLWHGERVEDSRKTHAVFLARLRALGVSVVDLKPAFERGGAPLDYFFRNDGHWNARGHALAARLVSAHLGLR